jgi:hypothetical protein
VNVRQWGTLIWTANAAGWFVIAYITGLVEAGLVSLGCVIVAALWNEFMPDRFGEGNLKREEPKEK